MKKVIENIFGFSWLIFWLVGIWMPVYNFQFFLTGCFCLLIGLLIAGDVILITETK